MVSWSPITRQGWVPCGPTWDGAAACGRAGRDPRRRRARRPTGLVPPGPLQRRPCPSRPRAPRAAPRLPGHPGARCPCPGDDGSPWPPFLARQAKPPGFGREAEAAGWQKGRKTRPSFGRWRHQFILGFSPSLTPPPFDAQGTQTAVAPAEAGVPPHSISLPSKRLQVEHTRMFFDMGN